MEVHIEELAQGHNKGSRALLNISDLFFFIVFNIVRE